MNRRAWRCWGRRHPWIKVVTGGDLEEISLIPKGDHPNPWVRVVSPGLFAYELGLRDTVAHWECSRCGKRVR